MGDEKTGFGVITNDNKTDKYQNLADEKEDIDLNGLFDDIDIQITDDDEIEQDALRVTDFSSKDITDKKLKGGINKYSTTYMGRNSFGNGTGYKEGLKVPIYDGRSIVYSGNPVEADSKKDFVENIYSNIKEVDQTTSFINKAPWSVANQYALFTYSGFHGASLNITKEQYLNHEINFLMGDHIHSKEPTIDNIIEFYKDLPVSYEYSDFMWTRWSGYMPNNHMITLRRFATPVEDNIISAKKIVQDEESKKAQDEWLKEYSSWKKQAGNKNKSLDDYLANHKPPPRNANIIYKTKPDIARAITWFGEETGNNLNELLSFSYGYNWNDQTSEVNTHEISADRSYTQHNKYQSRGIIGQSFFDVARGINASTKYQRLHKAGYDWESTTYPNFVIGPVNVIDKMTTQARGLNFNNDIKLHFEYKLRSYGKLNPKVAFLDIFANLLVLTYSNANFWGGANRFYGGAGYVAPRFGDDDKLRQGDFKGYLKSLVKDIGGGFMKAFAKPDGTFSFESIISGGLDIFGEITGNLLGSKIDSIMGPPPQAMALIGMITGEPTGNWHVTIGNPLNPITMVGNLILEDSNITFDGPLGYDDFPSKITLECTLKHARPRDKTDFESMFNAGKGRLYAAANDVNDILNLTGKDVKIYGAFQSTDISGGSGKVNYWKHTPEENTVKDENGNYKIGEIMNAYDNVRDEAESFVNR